MVRRGGRAQLRPAALMGASPSSGVARLVFGAGPGCGLLQCFAIEVEIPLWKRDPDAGFGENLVDHEAEVAGEGVADSSFVDA